MGPAKYHVKFSGKPEDFAEWRLKFAAMLDTMDLRDILLGEVEQPPQQNQEARAAWRKANQQIYTHMVLSLNRTTLRRIEGCQDDGVRAWQRIVEHFHGSDKLRQNKIKKELLSHKCDCEDDVDQYVLQIKELCDQLRATGQSVPDDDEREYIIQGLPASYGSFITMVLLAHQRQSLEEFEYQLQAFTKNRLFLQEREQESQSASALFVKKK
jgi:hypothetical protein